MSEEITITENRYNTALILLWVQFLILIVLFGLITTLTDPIRLLMTAIVFLAIAFNCASSLDRDLSYWLLSYVNLEPDWVMMDVDRDELAREGSVTIHK